MPETYSLKNPYPDKPLWIGKRYGDPDNALYRTLILGESTWGKPPKDDPEWIKYWFQKAQIPDYWDNQKQKRIRDLPDKTFSRLYWVTRRDSDRETCFELYRRTRACDLEEWFNLFAFYNYISKSIGDRNNRDDIEESYVTSQDELVKVCELIDPRFVWVLWPQTRKNGKVGSSIAINVLIKNCEIKTENIEVMPDFCGYCLSYEQLIASWQRLHRRMADGR